MSPRFRRKRRKPKERRPTLRCARRPLSRSCAIHERFPAEAHFSRAVSERPEESGPSGACTPSGWRQPNKMAAAGPGRRRPHSSFPAFERSGRIRKHDSGGGHTAAPIVKPPAKIYIAGPPDRRHRRRRRCHAPRSRCRRTGRYRIQNSAFRSTGRRVFPRKSEPAAR